MSPAVEAEWREEEAWAMTRLGAPDHGMDTAEAKRRDDGGFGPDRGGGTRGDRAQGAPLPGSMHVCVWWRAEGTRGIGIEQGGRARVRGAAGP